MAEGWVKLYRELLDKPIWLNSTPGQKTVLVTILLLASHTSNSWEWGGKKFVIQPGQFVTSANSLAEKSGRGVTRQIVRRSLDRFEALGFLTTQRTNESTLVTVANWGIYQGTDDNRTNHRTKDEPSVNQPRTTIKNVKNDKKKTPSSDVLLDRFNALWKLYPKKLGKQNSFKAYKKAIKDGATDDQIKTGIEAYVKYLAKEQTDPQYIKQGSSFFNQHSWEDDWSGGGITPEPQEPKPVDKAAALLRDIQGKMALHPNVSRQEAAKYTAKMFTANGQQTTAEKILAFLDKYEGKKDGNEQQ